jgi:Primase C terminal 2 (PriCT-2)/Bifunctional DNA primase/polymerase, N-terminal
MTPLDRGWQFAIVPPDEKGPDRKGWPDHRPSVEEVRRHLAAGGNIGVRLGPASGELVDIDLDCTEALALADLYLPATQAEFGRASKLRSHRLFIAPKATFETFADPVDGSMLLELRADGRDGGAHQTLFPPSVADGERREWHGEVIAPAVVSATFLRTAAAWLAVGALVRRYVSASASEHPAPDMPDLLQDADPVLGQAAQRWVKLPHRTPARPSREMTADEIDLAEMVAAIPNSEDWDGWNNMGLAIYAATGGSDHGGVIFDDWSAKSTKYNPYVTGERWRHYHRSPPSRTGIGKLISLALAAGWRPSDRKAGAR